MEIHATCQSAPQVECSTTGAGNGTKKMKIKVEVFRDKECKDSLALRNKEFSVDVMAKYSFVQKPDGTTEIDEAFACEFVKEASKKVSINLDMGTPNRDDGFANLEVEDREWKCENGSFMVQLRYCGVRVLLKSNENGQMVTAKDKTKPDEVFYLKGRFE